MCSRIHLSIEYRIYPEMFVETPYYWTCKNASLRRKNGRKISGFIVLGGIIVRRRRVRGTENLSKQARRSRVRFTKIAGNVFQWMEESEEETKFPQDHKAIESQLNNNTSDSMSDVLKAY